jgi:dolichol-phosphate mannosyltransferase
MVAKWDEGFDVVDAVKADRGREGLPYRVASEAFYALMGEHGGRSLRGSSDFKLLDRQVVDAVLRCPERNRFFRGLVAWVGFRVARVPFEVQARAAGVTSWSRRGLVAYSVRNLMAYSSAPLRLVAWMAFVTIGLDVLLAIQTFWNWARGTAVDGFTTVILALGALCGLILLSLGIVALYLAQMYDEQKSRPLFIVREERRPPA